MPLNYTPGPFVEITAGIVGLVFLILCHGLGIRIINHYFTRAWVKVHTHTPGFHTNILMASLIAALAALHLLETLLWAVPIHIMGMMGSARDAYYYVLESYTTLGESQMALPQPWRLLGPIIAMSGLFSFAWTSSVLVSFMNEFIRLDIARAKSEEPRPDDAAPDGAGAKKQP